MAIKTLSREAQPRSELDIRKEADAMHSLSHSNIIRLYGVVLNTSGPMMLVGNSSSLFHHVVLTCLC